jgi:hypothetical protein
VTLAPPVLGGNATPEFDPGLIQQLTRIMQNARDAGKTIDALKLSITIDQALRAALVAREFKQFERNSAQMDGQIAVANTLADANPAFNAGDQVDLIEDAWTRAKDFMPEASDFDSAEVKNSVVASLDSAKAEVNEVHFLAARVALPSQVKGYVLELRPGNSLSLNELLAEDVPDKDQRQRVIAYLATARSGIPAIIDIGTGMAVRYDPRKVGWTWARILLLTIGIPLLAFIATLVWPQLTQVHFIATPAQVSSFFPILIGVWIGAGAHLVVDVIKTRNSPRPLASVDDISKFVNSKEISILIGLLVLVVVAVGTAALGASLGPGGAFFVGYSADSFADIVLSRFDKAVSTQTASIKTVLGG